VQIDEVRRQLLAEGVPPDQVDEQLDALLPVRTEDALRQLGSKRYNIVAINPPFRRKSSIKVIGEEAAAGSDAITARCQLRRRLEVMDARSGRRINSWRRLPRAVPLCQRLEIGSTQPCTQLCTQDTGRNPLGHLRSQCPKGVFGGQNGE